MSAPLPEPMKETSGDKGAPPPMVGNYAPQPPAQPVYGGPPPPPPGYPPVNPGAGPYPPPPPGYPQQGVPMPGAPPPGMYPAYGMPYQAPPVVTVVQPNSNMPPPAHVVCASCHRDVSPFKTYETGFLTWIVAGGLCLFGLCCCAPIPFCTDCTKDERYTCPSCNHTLANVRRI